MEITTAPATDWGELPTLEAEALHSLELRELPTLSERTKTSRRKFEIELEGDRTFRRRSAKREFLHALKVKNAAKTLERLPKRGESLHAIMRGNYNSWDLVPALLRIIAPRKIRTLWVSTLGFNRDNADELVALMDAGKIGRCEFLVSCFFQNNTEDLYELIHHQLEKRGSRAVALRIHAKILLFELSDRRKFTIESSANLRSCSCIEQFCLTNDPKLFDFHAAWMREMIAQAEKASQ